MKETARHSMLIRNHAFALGFDLVGISPAESHYAEADLFERWLGQGYAGEMNYLERGLLKRKEMQRVLPGARSVVSCAVNYNTENPRSTEASGGGWISRYAWGDDYHDVMGEMLGGMADYITGLFPEESGVRAYVDTGPVLEKVHASRSGIGWVGKNTCLINQGVGSWLFLGEVITDIELDYDSAVEDRCGTCTRCIDACPTDAIVEPYVLDARKCISYLTIELKGKMPLELRDGVENNVFGCDVCQDVCPWNRDALFTLKESFRPREKLLSPDFKWLLGLDGDGFREVFAKSPVKRAKRRGFMRNVLVAVGNSGNKEYIKYARRFLADDEPIVRAHAVWALWRLGGENCREDLERMLETETDGEVLEEIHHAVGSPRN